MKRKKTKRKQQGCDVAKAINTVEQAVSTAKKVYRIIEPVVNAFTNRPEDQITRRRMSELITLVQQRIKEAPVFTGRGFVA